MKISELITVLQQTLEKNGDLLVLTGSDFELITATEVVTTNLLNDTFQCILAMQGISDEYVLVLDDC